MTVFHIWLFIFKFHVKFANNYEKIPALDIGRKRTGIAVTDTARIISSALETVETHKLEEFLKNISLKTKLKNYCRNAKTIKQSTI